MNRKHFYDIIRRNIFGGTLSVDNVKGIEALLDANVKHRVADPHHVANILAEVHHETGGYMMPIKETVYASHKNKNPSDQTVINRLESAFKSGKLPWVKTPYWRDGWFGRGDIQLTHEANYKRLGEAVGVDLVADRDKALDPDISAEIAVVGMTQGLFTGKALGDYVFPDNLSNKPEHNPRRIINGQDGTDTKVAKVHRLFYDALVAAGYDLPPVTKPTLPPVVTPTPAVPIRTASAIIAEIEALLKELKSLGG